jgi:hypothetical protein
VVAAAEPLTEPVETLTAPLAKVDDPAAVATAAEDTLGEVAGPIGAAPGSLEESIDVASQRVADAVAAAEAALDAIALPGSAAATFGIVETAVPAEPTTVEPHSSTVAGPDLDSGITSSLDALLGVPSLPDLDPADQRLLIAAGTLIVTTAVFSPDGFGLAREACAANARLLFTNVRLLPCVVEDAVRRSAAAAAEGVSRSLPARTRGAWNGGRGTTNPAVETRGAVQSFRDGFDRVVSKDAPEELGESGSARLLAQLGVVLGFVYLSFLTLWFWATRLRWNPRV